MNTETDYRVPRTVADYIWNVTIALPIVMAFIPGLWPLADQGFHALGTAPVWYQLLAAAAATFAFGRKSVETATAFLDAKAAKGPTSPPPPETSTAAT